jgi:hypothetical protein
MENRALQMIQKYFGLVTVMRKHQREYFKYKTEFDKKKSIEYEKKVDEYGVILKKAGLEPVFEKDSTTKYFLIKHHQKKWQRK